MLDRLFHPSINVRATRYLGALARCACHRCGREMVAIGIALEAGHQMCIDDGARGGVGPLGGVWRTVRSPAWLFDVEYLPRRVRVRLQRLSPGYRLAERPTTGGHRWLNHCPHCGAVQDDDDLHGEPDVAFMPFSLSAAERIELRAIDGSFVAAIGGHCDDPPLFGAMRRTGQAPT